MLRIALLPDLKNCAGGPSSFQKRLATGLQNNGISVCYGQKLRHCDAILLINSTRHIDQLLWANTNGIRIVQRLGLPFAVTNNLPIRPLEGLRIWVGMQNVFFTRRYLVERIIYQSHFVKNCWDEHSGRLGKPSRIIYNGVNLDQYSPEGEKYKSKADICIISVEGTQIHPKYSPAFLVTQFLHTLGYNVELLVFGNPWRDTASHYRNFPFVTFKGSIPNEELPFYYRGATFYVANDIIAACPNSVIEALACGTPVIGYRTAALPELLTNDAGICVPIVGNPWKGDPPGNIKAFAQAALTITEGNYGYRLGARRLSEERYDLNAVIASYLDILLS